ncbi:Putative Glutamate dehydrogenase [Rhizopus microsporus]|nr:Putative Glutamate dehydrogenase [Rhizopus microsporus]
MTTGKLEPPTTLFKRKSMTDMGYNANVFIGKNEQMIQVGQYLTNSGFIPKEFVQNEVVWFYENLGIDDYYFAVESVETIANHITALYGAKILAYTKNESVVDINLEKESEDSSVYIHSSPPGVSLLQGHQCEKRIDEKYLDLLGSSEAYRVESYRSNATAASGMSSQLRCYFVTKCQFNSPKPTADQERDIYQVADQNFLKKATEYTRKIYQDVMCDAGIKIFKDASANKGGVTSSSLEVLAALAFNDEEFEEHMCVKPKGSAPEFYQAYVKEVQEIIERNARLEFEALWEEHKKTQVPISILSDELSTAILQLNEQLQVTSLWSNHDLRHSVLSKAFPKLLLDKLGMKTLLERIPENYVKAIFGAALASQFVYKHGPRPDKFAFYDFMQENYI